MSIQRIATHHSHCHTGMFDTPDDGIDKDDDEQKHEEEEHQRDEVAIEIHDNRSHQLAD